MEEIAGNWPRRFGEYKSGGIVGVYPSVPIARNFPIVGRFEKVSYEQFEIAMKDEYEIQCGHGVIRKAYDHLELPTMATTGSAGYDFRAPFDIKLRPGESIKIPTGIRVYIEPGWFLGCFPRSSLGFKYRLQLDNTIGVIDSDYYMNKDNEGHIFVKMTNDGVEGRSVEIGTGEKFMQGIFLPYGYAVGTNVTTTRDGGIGSTGK